MGTEASCSLAWYTATSTAKVTQVNDSGTITVSSATKSIGAVPFNVLSVSVSFAPANSKTKLELAHYSTTTGNVKKLMTGYLDQSGGFHESADLFDSTNDALYGTVTASISLNNAAFTDGKITVGGNTYTKAGVVDMLNLRTDVPVTASRGETRARVFAYGAEGAGEASASSDTATSIADTISLATLTDSNTLTWRCYAYIYGGATSPSADSDANAAAVGTPTVTVTVGDPA